MTERWQGAGEAGVKLPLGVSEQHYKAEWCFGDLVALAELVAEKFGVQAPEIQRGRRTIRRGGAYFPQQQKIVLNRLWPGVVLHELAHHIVHSRYDNARSHGKEFYAVFTEVWQVAKDLVV
jgi:predicted SprT family Zn-dependent metalloprotease